MMLANTKLAHGIPHGIMPDFSGVGKDESSRSVCQDTGNLLGEGATIAGEPADNSVVAGR